MGDAINKTYLLVSEKPWHDELFRNLSRNKLTNWRRIENKDDFTPEKITALKPDIIFLPHWSYRIPVSIYAHHTCIIFHMTDLPYGRGGSPLQNLIIRKHKDTMISALKVEHGLDTGPVYLKKKLSLEGTAEEIFIRASKIIEEMIAEIILNQLKPKPQRGKGLMFRRRKPEESNMAHLKDLDQVYDYIRMLDCEGYPNAFLETDHIRFEFSKAKMNDEKTITAHVRITKK
jgi:methionyl-tRNA formyltransferase